MQSTVQYLLYSGACPVLGETSSSGVLNLESLPQEFEHRPRLTKCKDSEKLFTHIAAMKKCAYIGC